MESQRAFKRVNKPLEKLKQQIQSASPALSRSELLDLADDIHDIIRKRRNDFLLDHSVDVGASFRGWD